MKLMSHFKERKYQGNQRHDDDNKKDLPSKVSKIVDNTVKVMLTPAFGLRPEDRGRDSQRNQGSKHSRSSSYGKRNTKNEEGSQRDHEKKPKCWACGEIGHRSTDSESKAPPGMIHKDAPKRAKHSHAHNEKKESRSKREICEFYRDTGKCKFGARCKFEHDQHNGSNLKNLSSKQRSSINALKVDLRMEMILRRRLIHFL
jgi:hypothetical protein